MSVVWCCAAQHRPGCQGTGCGIRHTRQLAWWRGVIPMVLLADAPSDMPEDAPVEIPVDISFDVPEQTLAVMPAEPPAAGLWPG